jgi:large subunit ribosomal protein L10
VLDGRALSPADIVKLADLEPREVLLAKLAGAMKATMANAAATFAALPTQMARLAAALEEKRAAEGDGAAPAPADSALADSAPADSAPAEPATAEPAANASAAAADGDAAGEQAASEAGEGEAGEG